MKSLLKILLYVSALVISLVANAQTEEIPDYKPSDIQLHNTISKLDSIYFTAYNTCDMATQRKMYSEDLEFFHDKGGLATSKEGILTSLKNNICGKVTRTLIKGSIEVYPIPNYGAIQIGYHKFFNNQEPNAKSIPSKFIVVWKQNKDNWQITKVISLH